MMFCCLISLNNITKFELIYKGVADMFAYESNKNNMNRMMITATVLSMLVLNACKKENTDKVLTLEMKINGVRWVAAKNVAGLYNTSTNGINITGQTGDELVSVSRDNVTGNGTYAIPSGNMNALVLKAGAVLPYTASSSKVKSHGSVTVLSQTSSAISYIKNIEADFSGVLYDSFGTDSVVITEGKLRYQ
jgi:hypothetical protein